MDVRLNAGRMHGPHTGTGPNEALNMYDHAGRPRSEGMPDSKVGSHLKYAKFQMRNVLSRRTLIAYTPTLRNDPCTVSVEPSTKMLLHAV